MFVQRNGSQAWWTVAILAMVFNHGSAPAQGGEEPLSPDEWFELISRESSPRTEVRAEPQDLEQEQEQEQNIPAQTQSQETPSSSQPTAVQAKGQKPPAQAQSQHRAAPEEAQDTSTQDPKPPPQAALPANQAVLPGQASEIPAPPSSQPPAVQAKGQKQPFQAQSQDSAAPAKGQEYADQYLIDEWPDEFEIESATLVEKIQPAGRRSISSEWLTTQQRSDGRAAQYDSAAKLHLSRETLNYGEFSLQAGLAYALEADTAQGGQAQNSAKPEGRYLALIDGLPVTPNWLLDASGGVQPALNHPLATSGYGVNLPASLIDGYTATLSDGRQTLGYSSGQVGNLGGYAGLVFRPGPSLTQGISYERQFTPSWTLAAQGIEFKDGDRIPDHQSAAAVLRYQSEGRRNSLSLHGLHTNTGSSGYWLDGKFVVARWNHQLGGAFLEDGLLWNATQLSDNRVSVYWQANKHSFLQTLGSSFSHDKTNLSGDPSQVGSRTYSATLTFSRSLSYTLRAGTSANVNRRLGGPGLSAAYTTGSRISGFVSPQWRLGMSQLQATWSRLNSATQDTNQWNLSWDHSWALPPDMALSTSLAVNKTTELSADELRYSGGLSFKYAFDGGVKFNLTYNHGQVQQADLRGPQSSVSNSGNLGLSWNALGAWEWQLQAFINQSESERLGTNAGSRVDSRIQLSARKHISSGRPFNALGFRTAAGGKGSLSGQVYFDANANGRHDANEKVARGLLVYLDGRFISQTDDNGYYSFDPAHAGQHRVSIAIEDVPLPWILEDEAPRLVQIGVRESTRLDFPLIAPNF